MWFVVQVALSAVAERLSNMAKYNKFGISKDGSANDLRKQVSGIMHMFAIGAPPGSITREKADELYRAMKTGKSYGGWTVTGGGGGGKGDGNGKDEEDEDKDKKRRAPGIRDVDFSMEGKISRTNPLAPRGDKEDEFLHLIEPIKKMKSGGLVRGAGCAQRGRGKGKMV